METIIIIGGLSAGPSAAAKARRVNENAKILLFEKTHHISYATCGIPYAFSGKIKERDKLMVVKPELLEKRFKIEVHLDEEVLEVNPERHEILTPKGAYHYDKLVFATGARSFVPEIKNLEHAENWSNCRTIEDYDKMIGDGMLKDKQEITILGAGLVGVEVAENLQQAGKKVTIVELSPQVLPFWDSKFGYFAEAVLKEHGINIKTNVSAQEVALNNNQITHIKLSNGELVPTDYMIIGIGARPNTELLIAKGAAHLKNGAVIVNEKMETSLADIYAAGDCASIKNLQTGDHDFFPLGTHSNKGGRAAGANAAGGDEHFKGAYKTAIVKVYNHTLARTGLNARALKMLNKPFESSFSIATSTPSFYPDPKDIFTEIYYDPQTRELLGAEIWGEVGVDKRIDVLSTCIYAKLKVDDLPQLDLAYAPPFSPAKDPVVVAGFVATNTMDNNYESLSVEKLNEKLKFVDFSQTQLIDVRNPSELKQLGKIPLSTNIPLDDLRTRINELDRNKETIIYCAKGLRGYLTTMILVNHGFKNVKNVLGGFTAWKLSGYNIEVEKKAVSN